MLKRRFFVQVLSGVTLFAFLWGNRGALAAEQNKSKDGGAVAGIRTNNGNDVVEVLADGEEAPVKYVVGDGFDKKMLNGIFSVDRVQLVYKLNGEARQLVSIKKEKTQAAGTVTGIVLGVFDNAFWVAVKPKDGPPDGYAVNWPPEKYKDVFEKMKGLHKGDMVTIKFTTDGERHRIGTLQVIPAAGK